MSQPKYNNNSSQAFLKLNVISDTSTNNPITSNRHVHLQENLNITADLNKNQPIQDSILKNKPNTNEHKKITFVNPRYKSGTKSLNNIRRFVKNNDDDEDNNKFIEHIEQKKKEVHWIKQEYMTAFKTDRSKKDYMSKKNTETSNEDLNSNVNHYDPQKPRD